MVSDCTRRGIGYRKEIAEKNDKESKWIIYRIIFSVYLSCAFRFLMKFWFLIKKKKGIDSVMLITCVTIDVVNRYPLGI